MNTASVIEEVDAASDALDALDELQSLLGLDEDKAKAWIAEIRSAREAGRP